MLRGGNFVVAYIDGKADECVERLSADEYFVYVVEGKVILTAGGQKLVVTDRSMSIMPAGTGTIRFDGDARIVIVASVLAKDLLANASNAGDYEATDTDFVHLPVADRPCAARPLRSYRLDDYADRPMRLFRSENLMVNVFDHTKPRDSGALTPHSHDDFEQGSFAVAGDWMHHLRRPWGPDLSQWHDDEHLAIGSPSLVIIPAKMIHTSRSVNPGYAQLLDVFAPPRTDFVTQGLVCNADEYADEAMPEVSA